MTFDSSLLAEYLEHLHARIRVRSNTPTVRDAEEGLATLPDSVDQVCRTEPEACLDLVVAALREAGSPHVVQAIGDELLENLLNEHSERVRERVTTLLRSEQRFRFAFACAKYASVDPSVVNDWITMFQELGTTKQAERKKLWGQRFNSA